MHITDMVFVFEFLATFGVFMGICFWQLRSLDKLDREEAEKNSHAKNPVEKS